MAYEYFLDGSSSISSESSISSSISSPSSASSISHSNSMDNSTSNNDASMDGTANTMDMTGALGGLLSNPLAAFGSMERIALVDTDHLAVDAAMTGPVVFRGRLINPQ